MHVDGATGVMTESWMAEIEGLNEAALPVHVSDASSHADFKASAIASADEVRGLLAAIRRLQGIVEEETVALESRKRVDFDDFSMRKSHSMLEFVRLMRARSELGAEPEVMEEVQTLRQKLEKNRAVLEMHFEAAREVAAIIVRAVQEAESDGTYSARASQERK